MKEKILGVLAFASVALVFFSIQVHPQTPTPSTTAPTAARTYVGSRTCATCHAEVYQRWSKTRMANVVTDPKQRPERVIPDFTKPDPLLTFKLDDVALVYGDKWKQRYFRKVGNDYFPLPAQWDVSHKQWRAYMVQPNTDWGFPFTRLITPNAPRARSAMAATP